MNFFDLVSVAVAVVGTGLSAYFDLRTTYIPDEITHAMIGIGAILLFFRYPLHMAISYLAVGALVFLIGFLLYTFGQVGGGDVKLFAGITLLLPEHIVHSTIQSPFPPIISIFFASAMLATLFVSIKYMAMIYKKKEKIASFHQKLTVGLVSAGLVFAVFVFLSTIERAMLILSIPIIAGLIVFPFKEDMVDMFMLKTKRVLDLTEDDIIAVDKLPDRIKSSLGIGVRRTYLNSELEKIKKKAKRHRIKEVYVYDNLPTFGIYIFLGLIIVLLVGDPMFFLFSHL